MMNPVSLRLDGSVAVILIDNPPVNALSPETIDGLAAALSQAEADPAAKAIVVAAAGRTFIAGADIKGLENVVWGGDTGAPEMHDLLQRIEQCPKPVVMAIHGTALGGGVEVAMAAHYRVAVASAQLGLPEVNLGIIPGAEGTQRLPRLVGVDTALTMIVSGRPVKAAEALQSGLIDRIVDDLVPGAVAFAAEVAATGGPHPKTSERRDKLPAASELPAMVAAAHELAKKVRRHQHAPAAAIAAVAAAATLPFDEGCRRERELFYELIKSGQARAMIYAFFAERAVAKVPGVGKDIAVPPVSTVAIVGAGTMGSGIAMACANAGITVVLTDTEQAGLDRAMATIRKNYDGSVKKGRFTPGIGGRAHRPDLDPGGPGRIRRGRRDHRGRVREHGAQERRAGAARRRGPSRRAARHQHVHARHRRARRRDEAATGGHRHPLFQPGQRDAAGRDRARRGHFARDDRRRPGAGQAPRQSRRGRRQLPRASSATG